MQLAIERMFDNNIPMEAAELSNDLTEIHKLLDNLDHRLAFITNTSELGDAVCDITALGHRLQASTTRVAYAASNNFVAQTAGQRTVGQYVAARTNSRCLEVDRMVKTAKWLRDFPIFAAAHGEQLTDAHLHYLRTKLDTTYNTHQELVEWQQYFVDTAATCGYEGFITACEYWLVHVDPDGKEPKDQIERSSLRIGVGRGGRTEIDGETDAITGQAIRTAVEHEANKLRREDIANGIERTDSQRSMAALHNLVVRGFAREDGTFPAPLVNIVMSQKVAEWAINTLNGQHADATTTGTPTTVPVHPSDIDGRCELIDGTPIHPFLALQAMGLATGTGDAFKLRRVVMDAKSRVLDVSVNARSFPEWMRTTSLIESRGACRTPGCDAPHSWIEIDHVDPVANQGQTRLDNTEPLCRPDNHAKGAAVGRVAWKDRTPPPRRRPPRRSTPQRSTTESGDDDPDADQA